MDKSILFWWNPVHKPEDAHDSLPFLKLAALWSCKLSKRISMYVWRNPILNFFRPPPLFAYCQYWKWIKIALFWPFIYEINQSLKKKKLVSQIQLNKYETAPNHIQLSQNLTSNCLLISVFLPVFTSFCIFLYKIVLQIKKNNFMSTLCKNW